MVTTHVAEQDAASGVFGAGPLRPTLPTLAKAFGGNRIAHLEELVDDDIRSNADRLANLNKSQQSLERAGYPAPVYRSRHFALARDKVLAERLAIRAIEIGIS